MITCIPKGICSWDYTLSKNEDTAETSMNSLSETGSIVVESHYLPVIKHGLTSGHWTLELEGKTVATAHKESVFSSTFNVQAGDWEYTVRAESTWKRDMVVEEAGKTIALIRPKHAFTRRATIQTLTDTLDFPTLAFIFWMVSMIWKRRTGGST